MSKWRVLSACFVLALGLLYYLACRTPLTVANRICHGVVGEAGYARCTAAAAKALGPAAAWHGVAPSFLWTLAATILAAGWRVRLASAWEAPLLPLPALLNAAWEITQMAGLNDGRADLADVWAGLAAGMLVAGGRLVWKPLPKCIPGLFHWHTAVAIGCVGLIALADVWK